ncbi:MAG: septal ring lytic transglycosylase RlpA family protein, partial [Rhizobiaceae bacterium]
KWYTPREDFAYDKTGQASWYGPNFHGRLTANGEIYDQYALTAAHPTFPLPSYARVTNLANGRSIVVRVNDRGPYHEGRIIDLSAKASEMLDYQRKGVARVRVQYIKQAPLHGRDHKMLLASYSKGNGRSSSGNVLVSRLSRNISRPSLERLSDLTTGSIEPSKAIDDPFVAELKALEANEDTGSTLALRLRKFLAKK